MHAVRSISAAVLALVAVVILCESAPADIVSAVEPQGNEHLSRDRIILGFGFRVGDELTPEGVREGIRRLYDMGHFSDITVEVEPAGEGASPHHHGRGAPEVSRPSTYAGSDHVSGIGH